MRQTNRSGYRRLMGCLAALLLGMGWLAGCETHSFMDPSVVGRWERTPVVLPILDQLDIIDEPSSDPPGLTQVRPEDLVPSVQEYVIGVGDLVTFTIFELMVPGVESVQTRRVDELGMVRLPVIGPMKVEGMTPSQVEKDIAQMLEKKSVVKEATVSIIVQEQRQNTFSVIGESTTAGTNIGTFTILGKDFRLLDAMALARGVPGTVKKIFVIRQASMGKSDVHPSPTDEALPAKAAPTAPANPADLIQDLLKGVEPAPENAPPPTPQQGGQDAPGAANPWVHVNGKWVRSDQPQDQSSAAPAPPSASAHGADTASAPLATQRIIEIPYDRLVEGDTRYNIVVRPGDIIRVPPPTIGNIYVGGYISRPGTYNLPGDRDLTLKQLVFAAGNLSGLAIPERVDLIRRIGKNQEATVRLDLRAIFNGTQPDIFLKPNDTINVGTNFLATPLAVIRNGFRMSYGFGFILDRNFSENVFGVTYSN